MYKLLIIEDDAAIAAAVAKLAAAWEMETHIVSDFRAVLTEYAAFAPHIVLIDISLPFFSGYHWCAELRRISKVPILFLSSASDNLNMVMAMNLGADDFIAKPFDGDVLIAKMQALLRRAYEKARQENPALERLFAQEREQAVVQMNLSAKNYALAAEPMSNVYGALYSTLATDDPNQRKSMRYIGSCIGRIFYLLDKAERFETDKRSGRSWSTSSTGRLPL